MTVSENSLSGGNKYMVRYSSILLAVLFLFSGCTAAKTVRNKVGKSLAFSGSHLKKKVLLLPFENHTFLKNDSVRSNAQKQFLESLREECGDCVLIGHADPDFPESFAETPMHMSESPDNMALIRMASEAGVNAVIRGSIRNAESHEKEKGILIFKDRHYFAAARMDFSVFDSATGAKLLDESIRREQETDGAAFDAIKAGQTVSFNEINTLLENIAAEGGGKAGAAIRKQVWQAYVSAVEGNRLRLSSGRESGIRKGDFFEVFDRGEIIRGKNDQPFYIPGKKLGEMTAEEVSAGKTEGMFSGDGTVKAGDFVRLK